MSRHNTGTGNSHPYKVNGVSTQAEKVAFAIVEPQINSWVEQQRSLKNLSGRNWYANVLNNDLFTARYQWNYGNEIVQVTLKPLAPQKLSERIEKFAREELDLELPNIPKPADPVPGEEPPPPPKPQEPGQEEFAKQPDKRYYVVVFHSDNKIAAWLSTSLKSWRDKGVSKPSVKKTLALSNWAPDMSGDRNGFGNFGASPTRTASFQTKMTKKYGAICGVNLRTQQVPQVGFVLHWSETFYCYSPERGMVSGLGADSGIDVRPTFGIPAVASNDDGAVLGNVFYQLVGSRLIAVDTDFFAMGKRSGLSSEPFPPPSFDSVGYAPIIDNNLVGYTGGAGGGDCYEGMGGLAGDTFDFGAGADEFGMWTLTGKSNIFEVDKAPAAWIVQVEGLDYVYTKKVDMTEPDAGAVLPLCYDGECINYDTDIFLPPSALYSYCQPYRPNPSDYTIYRNVNGATSLSDAWGGSWSGFAPSETNSPQWTFYPTMQVSNGEHQFQGFKVYPFNAADVNDVRLHASLGKHKIYFDGNVDITGDLAAACGCQPNDIQYVIMDLIEESLFAIR